MKRMMLALALAAVTAVSFAQGPQTSTISITAKGDDVRSVITDMFKQAGKNFVLSPGVRFVLYLSLDKVSFDDALDIICKNANLKFEVENGIYYIANTPAKPVETKVIADVPKVVEKKDPPKPVATPAIAKPKNTLPIAVLNRHITTRYHKTDLREVLDAFTTQTGVKIEVAPDVPAFKLDAYLIGTSLKYALDCITEAANLEYKLTDSRTILITKALAKPATAAGKTGN